MAQSILELEARRYRQGNRDAGGRGYQHPETHAEWVERYSFLDDAYHGVGYTVADIRAMKLFRALDPDGEVIAETRRLTQDVRHVVDTDAQGLAGQSWSLDLQDDVDESLLADAEAVWRRSRVQQKRGAWARTGAGLGSVMIEAVRMNGTKPYNVTFAAYDPRHVRLDYDDATGTTIERAVISMPYFESTNVTAHGEDVGGQVLHTYVRVLDRESVTVYRDGVLQADESGPHNLGVVPLVHLPFVETLKDPAHGLWAAQGLEHALSLYDSLLTQTLAIGNRHANPLMVAKGTNISGNTDLFAHGRILTGVPKDGGVSYLEAQMTGVTALLDAAKQALSDARQTLPEFLFTEAGASSSGSALNFRASAFVAKIEEVRGRWFSAFARLTEYAVCMERGIPYQVEADWFRVSAPPVLPVNAREALTALHDVLDRGGLKRVDYIRALQRLELVPAEVDPEEYAREVEDERIEAAALESGNLAAIFNGGGVETTAAPVGGQFAGEDVEIEP